MFKNNYKKILIILGVILMPLTFSTVYAFGSTITTGAASDPSESTVILNGLFTYETDPLAFMDPIDTVGRTVYFKYSDTNSPCLTLTHTTTTKYLGAVAVTGNTSKTFTEKITGLKEDTTYYYCAVLEKDLEFGGTIPEGSGTVKSFKTAAPTIIVSAGSGTGGANGSLGNTTNITTGETTAITDTSAMLQGSVKATDFFTFGYFRYSTAEIPPVFCNDVYGSNMQSTKEVWVGTIGISNTFRKTINDLEPNTTYYYCAVSSAKKRIEYGNVGSFTTAPDPLTPSASTLTTKNALVVNANSAYLNGVYNSATNSSTWFEYKKKFKQPGDVKYATEADSQQKITVNISGGSYSDLSIPTDTWLQTSGNPASSRGAATSKGGTTGTTTGASTGPIDFNAPSPSLGGGSTGNTGSMSVGNISLGAGSTGSFGGLSSSGPSTVSNGNSFNATNVSGIGVLKDETAPSWGTKVGIENHTAGNAGEKTFLLTGLTQGITYQYRLVMKKEGSPTPNYANVVEFQTASTGESTPGEVVDIADVMKEKTINAGPANNTADSKLGEKAIPPNDAIVRYHEGIETVFSRQIINNPGIAKLYGYKDGDDIQGFSWYLAHFLAKKFGYVGSNGKEIRVSKPDIAAYELRLSGSDLTIYEYFDFKIVNVQKVSSIMRTVYKYEYYFKKIFSTKKSN